MKSSSSISCPHAHWPLGVDVQARDCKLILIYSLLNRLAVHIQIMVGILSHI